VDQERSRYSRFSSVYASFQPLYKSDLGAVTFINGSVNNLADDIERRMFHGFVCRRPTKWESAKRFPAHPLRRFPKDCTEFFRPDVAASSGFRPPAGRFLPLLRPSQDTRTDYEHTDRGDLPQFADARSVRQVSNSSAVSASRKYFKSDENARFSIRRRIRTAIVPACGRFSGRSKKAAITGCTLFHRISNPIINAGTDKKPLERSAETTLRDRRTPGTNLV
jgi:hypothetical protein